MLPHVKEDGNLNTKLLSEYIKSHKKYLPVLPFAVHRAVNWIALCPSCRTFHVGFVICYDTDFVNCNWVDSRWQFTVHIYTQKNTKNSTMEQNTQNIHNNKNT
jgi:hypothetical protein